MSRVGDVPVEIPERVEVSVTGNSVTCKGPLGETSEDIHESLSVDKEDNAIVVRRSSNSRQAKSLHGLARSLISNMLEGVSNGYKKVLKIHGTGYRAVTQDNKLNLTLGFSHPVIIEAPEGIEFETPEADTIIIKGYDKQLVGETAARIRQVRPPEPYLGKGIRYKDERVRRKEGKTATATTTTT